MCFSPELGYRVAPLPWDSGRCEYWAAFFSGSSWGPSIEADALLDWAEEIIAEGSKSRGATKFFQDAVGWLKMAG
jgi:hypothetical protein